MNTGLIISMYLLLPEYSHLSFPRLPLSQHLPLSNWKANKQYVLLTTNASTWRRVKISFATWHANCKWNTRKCPIRQTAVTHFPRADAQRQTTGPVRKRNKHRNWSWLWGKSSSSGDEIHRNYILVETRNSGVLGVASRLLLFRTHRDFLLPGNILYDFSFCW